MATESSDTDIITEARRIALQESLHTVSVEQMKALGEELFPFVDHPWRAKFFDFMSQNEGATFYHGITHDGVHIVYCREKGVGLWFVPGSGTGILQPKGLEMLKQIVETL